MDTFLHNVRFALRLLIKNRGFTVAAVLTLALGIGANTAIFSLVNTVLFRQLCYKNPDHLVWIWSVRTDRDKSTFSLPDFMDYGVQNRTLDQISGFVTWSANLVGKGEPERVMGVRSSANIFQMLGVDAEIGRTLIEEDDDPANPRVVVLSHGFWKRRFGGRPEILGNTLTLNDVNYTVVGVLRPDFGFPGMEADIVVPLVPDVDPLRNERSSISFLRIVGRLKQGITLQQAETDLTSVAKRLQQLYPIANATKKGAKVVPLHEELVANFRLALIVLSAAIGLVLLIACANLANLLLARASTREREMTIRLAIGATRTRLVKQLLTENILLALLGGLLGFALLRPAIQAIVALSPASLPRLNEITIDTTALIFTVAISFLSGLLFGAIPAFKISKENLTKGLTGRGLSDGSSKNNVRNLLILAEVALSLLLLIGAGLLVKSFVRLQKIWPGFEIKNLLVMRLSLSTTQYSNAEVVTAFYERLSGELKNVPAVRSVSVTSVLPLSGSNVRVPFTISGRPPLSASEQPVTQYRMTAPNYFRTMKIAVLAGRDFARTDTSDSQPVAIINETFARRYWPGPVHSAVGSHIEIDDNNQGPRDVEIIAVVGDVRHMGLHMDPAPETYVPLAQIPEENVPLLANQMSWVIRTSGEPLMLSEVVRREVQSTNPHIPTTNIKNMEQILATSLASDRFNFLLLAVFAIAALILASMGIYAVISNSVSQRAAELGLRIALGARKRDLLQLVVGGSLKLVLTGIVIGLTGAFLLTRLLSSLIFGISTRDLTTFVSMPLLFVLIALLASYIPARRATKIDPILALRSE